MTLLQKAGILALVLPLFANAEEKIDVDKLQEKYWAQGKEAEMGVVQNRRYSKVNRFDLGFQSGILSSDPFLSTHASGLTLGYSFTETWGVRSIAWKAIAAGSSARRALEQTGKKASTNEPEGYAGAEAVFSPIYGKLSVLGKSIIHYDFHLLGGVGVTFLENPSYPSGLTGHAGVGQQMFLRRNLAMQVDYRMMVYREHLREKEIPSRLGEDLGARTNFTHAITLGVNWFFGGPKEE